MDTHNFIYPIHGLDGRTFNYPILAGGGSAHSTHILRTFIFVASVIQNRVTNIVLAESMRLRRRGSRRSPTEAGRGPAALAEETVFIILHSTDCKIRRRRIRVRCSSCHSA